MSTCLMVGAVAMSLASPDFTLHWTHSVEKVEWVENWRVEDKTLTLTRAAVKGSGAGMEPGDGATFENGWWVWHPETKVPELILAASGATVGGWQICDGATCTEIGATAGAPVVVKSCNN